MMEPIKVKFWFDYIEDHPNFTGCLLDEVDDVKYWYKKGYLHREDGPAVEPIANAYRAWYLNNTEYSEQEWLIAMRKNKLKKVLKKIEG